MRALEYHDLKIEYDHMKQKLEGSLVENKRLKDVLQEISVWGYNGQCVELCMACMLPCGTKCPCCMAEEALAGGAE
jgi:hypothetical protein